MKTHTIDLLETRPHRSATAGDFAVEFARVFAAALDEKACGCSVQHLSPPPSSAFGCGTAGAYEKDPIEPKQALGV